MNYFYQQLKWILLTKPYARDAHVYRILCETFDETSASVDGIFGEIFSDYMDAFE